MLLKPAVVGAALTCAFFAIAFLQSGFDKVADRRGNLEWLMGHFAKSPLKGSVPALLLVVTLMELASGLLSLIAVGWIAAGQGYDVAVWAISLSLATLLMLFFGQRVAKDYAGAAVIAAYVVVGLGGLALLAMIRA